VSREHEKQKQALAKSAALRKRLGVTLRRRPGPLPQREHEAFARIVEQSELRPWELIDELLGVLLERFPAVPVSEAARWLAAPTQEDSARAIIGDSGREALAGAPDPARTEGGSDR